MLDLIISNERCGDSQTAECHIEGFVLEILQREFFTSSSERLENEERGLDSLLSHISKARNQYINENRMNNDKPQIIKVQALGGNNSNMSANGLAAPGKQILYLSQSPMKCNKLIKFSPGINQQPMQATSNGNKIMLNAPMALNLVDSTASNLNSCNEKSEHMGDVLTVRHATSQEAQQQQMVSFVLLTDNQTGGMSYLSLVPQN